MNDRDKEATATNGTPDTRKIDAKIYGQIRECVQAGNAMSLISVERFGEGHSMVQLYEKNRSQPVRFALRRGPAAMRRLAEALIRVCNEVERDESAHGWSRNEAEQAALARRPGVPPKMFRDTVASRAAPAEGS